MFGKVKQYLGIEGVKLEVLLPEEVAFKAKQIDGKIRLSTMNAQTVTSLKVQLIERYARGRGKDKKLDEYTLGTINLNEKIKIPNDSPIEIEFTLTFEPLASEVDDFANKNPLFKGLAGLARRAYNAESSYFVLAEAEVKGTALNPFIKQAIDLK